MSKPHIEFFRHAMDDECLEEFNKTARNLFITTGPKTEEFEKAFAEYLNVPHAVGTMSCTHSLQLAYLTLGIGQSDGSGPSDEVIVPAFTFLATATSVIHAGAKPIFVDVDPRTGILDPDAVEHAITSRTKAICPVHLYGVMAPMERFAEIAKKYGIKLVEDAAHCIEGRGPRFGPGTLSDAAAFSFYATKNITCGEGGALVTRHDDVANKAKILRNHGMDRNAVDRFNVKLPAYDVRFLGFKSNMNDLQASLLLPQLRKIEERLKRRAEIVKKYNEGLAGVKGITLPVVPDGYKTAHHLYTIRISPDGKRDEFLSGMNEAGVHCSVNFRPISDLYYFREELGLKPETCPNATAFGNSVVTLPLYPSLRDDEVSAVIESVKAVAKKLPA